MDMSVLTYILHNFTFSFNSERIALLAHNKDFIS